MHSLRKTSSIIDADTGEVLYSREDEIPLNLFSDAGFVLLNRQPTIRMYPRLSWKLSGHDQTKMMALMPYLDPATNCWMREDRKNHPMTVKHISEATGLSLSRTFSFLKRMREMGVIRLVDTFFYVNPLYQNARGRVDETLYRTFEAELKPFVTAWMRKQIKERWG